MDMEKRKKSWARYWASPKGKACKRRKDAKYFSKPEVIERRRAYYNTPEQIEKRRRYAAEYTKKVYARAAAQAMARSHLKDVQPCSYKDCNRQGERHHPDYKQPLLVMWLCRKHHSMLHKGGK